MRTKTLLLSAAAMFAAGIVSSQAQAVYSQNIVGYASVPAALGYTMLSTPFNVGVSNGANEIYGANLAEGMVFVIWNGAGYNQTLYSPSLQSAFSLPTPWMDQNFNTVPIPTLPPGQGYFLYSPTAGTNTAAGVVAVNVGATNNMGLALGYSMVGSVIPAAGSVTNSIFNAPVQEGTVFVIWNGAGYTQTLYSPSLQSAFGLPTPWMDQNFNTVPAPSLTVGQGFFLYEPTAQNWTEVMPSN